MTGGLTAEGYVATTQQEYVADLNAAFLANLSATLDLSPDQPFGQIVNVIAQKLANLSELGATVYNAINPDAAEGQLLVNVCSITGTRPQAATFSQVLCTITLGSTGVTVPAGSVISVVGQPNNRWTLQTAVVGPLSGSPPFAITGCLFYSETEGAFVANASTLTVIDSPVIGWTGVTNPADAQPGNAGDTDTTLRQRRVAELAEPGSGNTDAITAKVIAYVSTGNVNNTAYVFENTSLVTDANGVPGKSIHVVVNDSFAAMPNGVGDGAPSIAQTIWDNKPSGVLAYGSISALALDSHGQQQPIGFDRATTLPIYIVLTTTPATITSAQITAIKSAIVAYATTGSPTGGPILNLGVEVVALAFQSVALQALNSVIPVTNPPTITDIPSFFLGTSPSPTGTSNISVSGLQIATILTTQITVNGT